MRRNCSLYIHEKILQEKRDTIIATTLFYQTEKIILNFLLRDLKIDFLKGQGQQRKIPRCKVLFTNNF